MNAPSEDVKDMLVAESWFNLTFQTNLFIGREPAKPNNTVTILDSYGYPPDLSLVNQGYERPSVQILVKSSSYLDGLKLAQDIKDSLHGRSQETWNGTLYTVITCSSGPALLEWNENSLARFSINFNLQRRVA